MKKHILFFTLISLLVVAKNTNGFCMSVSFGTPYCMPPYPYTGYYDPFFYDTYYPAFYDPFWYPRYYGYWDNWGGYGRGCGSYYGRGRGRNCSRSSRVSCGRSSRSRCSSRRRR